MLPTSVLFDPSFVQPNHGGELIQYGWNAGPRHARVFGLVKNMTHKKLTADEQHKKDGDILGILALTWNLLTSTLPEEVIVPIKAAIKAAGLPPMAYKDDAIKGMQHSPHLFSHLEHAYWGTSRGRWGCHSGH